MARKRHNPVVSAYAQALLELAEADGQLAEVGVEASQLDELLTENPTFRAYLANPAVNEEECDEKLRAIFEGNASSLMVNFLRLVNRKGRIGLLPEIVEAFEHLLDERLGKVEVDVVVAARLSDEQLEQVRARVSGVLNKDAVVHQYVDESIIGGLVVKFGDKVIDASIRKQLESMRQRLMSAARSAER